MFGVMLGLEVNKMCFPVAVVTNPAKLSDVLSEHFKTEETVPGVCSVAFDWETFTKGISKMC